MRVFVLVTCLVAGVLGRPDIGYSYSGLQQNLGSQQNGLNVKPLVHQQLPAEQSFASFVTPLSTYGAPPGAAPTASNLIEQPTAPTAPEEPAPQSLAPQPDSYNTAYQHSTDSQDGGYAYAPQLTSIHKHIYVHVPPKSFEDEDVIETHVRHQAAPKQKHYKIVFIKAPAAPSICPPVVPPPPQNEEQTLIYVLHKKPEATKDIIIPTAVPTKPSKPEVYFIKYQTKKEQAPVYGPPPPQSQGDIEPRIAEPVAEYGTPVGADGYAPKQASDLAAPITTLQPAIEQEQPQQFTSDLPAEPFEPTSGIDQAQSNALAAPSNQYLAPEQSASTPIVVDESAHVPSSSYGPPSRLFLKKKK